MRNFYNNYKKVIIEEEKLCITWGFYQNGDSITKEMMKMNSKKTSVYEALNLFFYYYLKKRDIEKTLSMVTDDIYSLGTGNGEIALNKIQFRDLITSEINALPISIDYRILNYREKERAKNLWELWYLF